MGGRGRGPCSVVGAAVATAAGASCPGWEFAWRESPPSFPHHTSCLIGMAGSLQLNQGWAQPWELCKLSFCLFMKGRRAPLGDLVPGFLSCYVYLLDTPECFWVQFFPKKLTGTGTPCMSVLWPSHTLQWSREAPSYPQFTVEQVGWILAIVCISSRDRLSGPIVCLLGWLVQPHSLYVFSLTVIGKEEI